MLTAPVHSPPAPAPREEATGMRARVCRARRAPATPALPIRQAHKPDEIASGGPEARRASGTGVFPSTLLRALRLRRGTKLATVRSLKGQSKWKRDKERSRSSAREDATSSSPGTQAPSRRLQFRRRHGGGRGGEGSPGNSNGPWVNGSSLLIAVCGPKSSTTCSNSLGDPYVCVQVRIYGIAGRSPQKNQ